MAHVDAMLLSVIIAAYNEQRYLTSCVASLRAALGPDSEIIIIDDGSTDDTRAIAERLAKQYPEVQVLWHPENSNRGVSASRNLGIEHAAGKYVTFFDADDLCVPSRFEVAVEALEAQPDIDGVLCTIGVFFTREEDKVAWDGLPVVFDHDRGIPRDGFAGATLQGRSRFLPSNLVFRKTLLRKSGIFDVDRRIMEDLHLWLRMALTGNFIVLGSNEPQIFYRRHAGNTWALYRYGVFVDLEVIADVLRWARKVHWVSCKNVKEVEDAFVEKVFYCLTLARADHLFVKGIKVAGLAGRCCPRLLLCKRYWANVLRIMTKVV